ncbi:MAG: sigma-54 dependent transcriptional regulator [Desulfovibrionaceae bacterium]|nr:sigma-54 dependent transcriptional regulator [Desulfovibrionaceae bacterium]
MPGKSSDNPQAACGPDGRTILVVDDDAAILEVLEARLASAGYRTLVSSSAETALKTLGREEVDLIISDVKMPGIGGAGLLREVSNDWPDIPLILLTAYGTIPDAVDFMRTGAADYLTKPFDGNELLEKISGLLKARKRPGAGDAAISEVLWGGRSPVMRKFYELLARVSHSEVNVLIVGESGTGKEMVARILHRQSPRAKGPFVTVDCGSTPASLLESELFGHVKGSFTHALKDKKGLIEVADKGTLLLDEIGNISPEMQTRLLRFLQEHIIRRVGDTKEIPVSCRVLAATNADLTALVRKGAFREDLYFRLKVVTLNVPPLRERREDIPLLVERFLEEFCKEQGRARITPSPEAMRLLMAHPWPGNVRELKHALEAGVVFCKGGALRPEDLQIETTGGASGPDEASLSLEDNEHQAIIKALERSGWVKKAAADLLGISRRAIHYKIKKYGIKVPERER